MSVIASEIIIIVLLVLANGMFAMAELAIISCRKAKLRKLAEQGDPRAQAALELAESPNPHFQIPAAAREHAADLIVIATHGDSLVPHCLLGNTAEQVVRRAPCPVWVVPGLSSEEAELVPALFPLQRILVATDFSAESRKALRYGVALAREFDATLHLVHVVPTVLPADVSHLSIILQDVAMKEAARRDLARLRTAEIPADLQVVTTVLDGNPFLELDNEARRVHAGLIVVSTHGYTGLRYLLLGSTAQHVVERASVPVLVVREHEPDFIPLTELGTANSP
ncbi:MAG: hypothetical protein RL514_3124 [Verrucomicrobiota bacterium]|jgi:nucleotide-binding universal stress UspA family protein